VRDAICAVGGRTTIAGRHWKEKRNYIAEMFENCVPQLKGT